MADVVVKADLHELAQAGAEAAIQALRKAIEQQGRATWVLAGGTAPMGAYAVLAERYQDTLDWPKVQVLIGDERCVPLGHADANWEQISNAFLDKVPLEKRNKLRPKYELPAEDAATDYEKALGSLDTNAQGIPRFDHVWLGMGEDGHTLSLFPGHPALKLTEPLVVPIHDSPKPPPDRISLTLRALTNVNSCVIMASGAGKADVIAKVMSGDASLPIVQAVQTIELSGGKVTWLLDTAAAERISYNLSK